MTNAHWDISGKTALVTGAAKRIGRAVALSLAASGAHVVVHYRRSAAEAERLVQEIDAMGARGWAVPADLADPRAVEALLPRITALAGPVDILVNNASTFHEADLNDLSPEDLHANVQLHAAAPLILSRQLAAQGRAGAIVNLLDARIVDYDRGHAAYHLSKRMLYSLTRMMALEFAPRIRVNAVAPGLILPPEGKDQAYLERLASTNPLQRYGDLEAVTDAILFLLRSDFITGQVVFVDGGRHLRGCVYG